MYHSGYVPLCLNCRSWTNSTGTGIQVRLVASCFLAKGFRSSVQSGYSASCSVVGLPDCLLVIYVTPGCEAPGSDRDWD